MTDPPKHVDTIFERYATPYPYRYNSIEPKRRAVTHRVGNQIIFPLCAWGSVYYYIFDLDTYQVSEAPENIDLPDEVYEDKYEIPSYCDDDVVLDFEEASIPTKGRDRFPVEVTIVARPAVPGDDWPEKYKALHEKALEKSLSYYMDVFHSRHG